MLKKFLPLTLLAVTTAAFAAGNQTTPTSSVANSASASTSATAASSTTSTTSTPASPVVVSSPSQAQAQHELTVQVDHLPQILDPLKADVFGKDADTLYLVSAVLVAPRPELTTLDHSTTSKDFRTWELTLKPRFWSDGKPVTAAEYVAAFHRLAQAPQGQDVLAVLKLQNFPEVASGALPVEKLGVSAKDEHTLVLTLSEGKPNLTDYLTNPAFAPERADNDYGLDKFLSSGLYKVAQATDSSHHLKKA